MFNPNTECRVENHLYRWTIVDEHFVNGVQYVLLESAIGDEAPYILAKLDRKLIEMRTYTNKRTGAESRLPTILAAAVVDDEVYDDIMTALYDNDIL